MSFAVMLPLISSILQSSQENTNRRNGFDSNIATLVNSPYTGRNAGNFGQFLQNNSLGNLATGLGAGYAQNDAEKKYADELKFRNNALQSQVPQQAVAQTQYVDDPIIRMGMSNDFSFDPNKKLTFGGYSSALRG